MKWEYMSVQLKKKKQSVKKYKNKLINKKKTKRLKKNNCKRKKKPDFMTLELNLI